jgi:tetratricopeptide (TPR) repeat protein
MSKWFLWIILSSLTGSPIGSAVALLVFYWAVDRFTFRMLPDPVAFVRKRMRAGKLKGDLVGNPHDRRARYELAEIMISRKRYARAVELLRPNLEAGDDDVPTLYTMGLACLGAGHPLQGEKLMDHAAEKDPGFRLGAIELERGRWRLERGDAKGAQEALKKALTFRSGSIEARVLLARAIEAGGDDGAAALMREEAWREYVGSPAFHRRAERFWAWRAKPSRPALYAVGAARALFLFGTFAGPQVAAAAHQMSSPAGEQYEAEDDGP